MEKSTIRLWDVIYDIALDLAVMSFGVWVIDQGIDAVQLGFMNTLLIAIGIRLVFGPILHKIK